jgi:universal stress protein E
MLAHPICRKDGWRERLEMGLRRLLATTDFSARSEHAVQRAALLCAQFKAELQLLHVVDDDQPTHVVEQELRQATELVKAKASELRDTAGDEPATTVKAGDPFQAIVQVATEANVDLVAMGAHRRRILQDVFVGTTIERVMRTGPHPVLMVNREPKRPYRRVVAAIDMSEASANALGSAKSLGLLDSAHVSLVHAFEPFAKGLLIYANIEREKIEAHVAQETTQTRRKLIDFVTNLQLGELNYDLCLEDGPTFRAIRDFVDKKQPELLVIGTRGLTGIQRILLGSVADALLRGLECDILAVPPRQEE